MCCGPARACFRKWLLLSDFFCTFEVAARGNWSVCCTGGRSRGVRLVSVLCVLCRVNERLYDKPRGAFLFIHVPMRSAKVLIRSSVGCKPWKNAMVVSPTRRRTISVASSPSHFYILLVY